MDVTNDDGEQEQVSEATAFLETRGIAPTAKEFRLRQEFFRHGWDLRVRDEGAASTATAVKPNRPDVATRASAEGNVLRLALAQALRFDDAAPSE